MLVRKIIINGCVAIFLGTSFSTFAQFGTGDDSIGQFLSENPDLKQIEEKHVDVPYEKGSSVFYGRSDAPKLSYCVMHKGKKTKVKRSSMYSYKQSDYTTLSNNLFNCDKPESRIISELDRKDFIHVLYFLNVKYKLDLKKA